MISPTGTNEIKPHINTNRERNLEGKGGEEGMFGAIKNLYTHTHTINLGGCSIQTRQQPWETIN